MLHAARSKYRTQKIAICAPSHKFVGLYLRNYGTYRKSEKNLLNSNIFSTCPHNMVNFGSLMAAEGERGERRSYRPLKITGERSLAPHSR